MLHLEKTMSLLQFSSGVRSAGTHQFVKRGNKINYLLKKI